MLGVGAVRWAAPYDGVARELVAALKFGGRLGLARVAAGAIVAAIGDRCRETGAVVAVPPAPFRRLRRGFDPAELIARSVAAELGVAFTPALRRTQGPRQVGRRRVERLTSAPRVRAGGPAPSPALLIDDVLTTGATLSACAAALRRSGCVDVSAAVFARTLAPGGHRPKIGGASASR